MSPLRTIQQRVQRGAEWLDTRRPGWADAINLGWLSMTRCNRCILGQLFGDYYRIVDVGGSDRELTQNQAMRKGFDVPSAVQPSLQGDEYEALTRLWKHQIRKRLLLCR